MSITIKLKNRKHADKVFDMLTNESDEGFSGVSEWSIAISEKQYKLLQEKGLI